MRAMIDALHSPDDVRRVEGPTNGFVAVATWDQLGPVIYFWPAKLATYTPMEQQFTWAHELGHFKTMEKANPTIPGQINMQSELLAHEFAINYFMSMGRQDIVDHVISQLNLPGRQQEKATFQSVLVSLRDKFITEHSQAISSVDKLPRTEEVDEDKPFSAFINAMKNGIESLQLEQEDNVEGTRFYGCSLKFPGASTINIVQEPGDAPCISVRFKRENFRKGKETYNEIVAWAKRDLGDSWESMTYKNSSGMTDWHTDFSKVSSNVKMKISYGTAFGYIIKISFTTK